MQVSGDPVKVDIAGPSPGAVTVDNLGPSVVYYTATEVAARRLYDADSGAGAEGSIAPGAVVSLSSPKWFICLYTTSASLDVLQVPPALPSGSGLPAETVDTGEAVKYIALTGPPRELIPIPADADAPAQPVEVVAVARLTSVRLTWAHSARASTYTVYRDGVEIGTAAAESFRDSGVTVGAMYAYGVRAFDQYGQPSALSDPAAAFIDAALNAAPVLDIRTWPAALPLTGTGIIRANALDADVQQIAFALDVDTGSLRATEDPSVWLWSA
jgi:hypothetical protein